MMKPVLLAASLLMVTGKSVADPLVFELDPGHSQVLFSYEHLGYSTTWGMFSGFEGEITFDQEDPAQSSVTVSIPATSMMTGWQERFDVFMSSDFFDAKEQEYITFTSTGIAVTGEQTADITGDLSIRGVTKPVILAAQLNQVSTNPMENRLWAGFDAETTLKRSDFGMGLFVPFISDEVQLKISIEAKIIE